MKTIPYFTASAVLVLVTMPSFAAVSVEEAKALGTTLTPVGADMAGNAEKTIPPYTGGLTTPPKGFQSGSGVRPDPFESEKPLYTIKAADVEKYGQKLTAGTKELLKRYPSVMRLDVYPSHRTAAFPKFVEMNTLKNATAVSTVEGGLGVEGTYAGVPFPIPKTGTEVMWNHALRYMGTTYATKSDSINVDSSGKAVLATTAEILVNYLYWEPSRVTQSKSDDPYLRVKILYTAPARRAGESLLTQDYVRMGTLPRKAWQYLPGQRRVKLAPDVTYDTPNPATAGNTTYDDSWLFNGAMDRYDWKLVGKREMLIPYNSYKMLSAKDPYAVATPNVVNPDYVRWELHRVWVVEATLKEGKRHVYAKRVFYADEDSWAIVASDQYDARGQLFRAGFDFPAVAYDQPALLHDQQAFYDFVSGGYSLSGLTGAHSTGVKFLSNAGSPNEWSPDYLAGAGVR